VRSTPSTTSTGRRGQARQSGAEQGVPPHLGGVERVGVVDQEGQRLVLGPVPEGLGDPVDGHVRIGRQLLGIGDGGRLVCRGDLGPEGDQVPHRAGARHLQGCRQQRRPLYDVLAAPGLVDGPQAAVAHCAPDHAEAGVPEVGRDVVQHGRPAGLRGARHDDDPPIWHIASGPAPGIHDPVDHVGEVARVGVGAFGHACASSTSCVRDVRKSLVQDAHGTRPDAPATSS
jgi:hypothetical protein